MNELLFSGKMKLADLIMANPNLILMLPRFGIPMGFGEASVDEICAKNNVPTDFFLLVCNVYTFQRYMPQQSAICLTNMRLLVPYLEASHHYYLQERLPHIEKHLYRIADKIQPKFGTVIKQFFAEYKKEVTEHFAYEEKNIFPHIHQTAGSTANTKNIMHDFAEAHSNIEDKLTDLTQIVFKYLPENMMSDESIELVFDILQLSTDLNRHALIEEKILLPYVESLEINAI